MEDLTIDEISLDQSQSLVTISDVPDRPGVAAAMFDELAKAGVFVDMIVQSFGRDGQANLSLTVPQTEFGPHGANWPSRSPSGSAAAA